MKIKNSTVKEIHKLLNRKASKDWGPKCKDYYYECSVCQIYVALDILEHWADIEEEIRKEDAAERLASKD